MTPKEYLAKVAHIEASTNVYLSNYDNSYITTVGMEDNIKHLADREITEKLSHGVGFSPKNKKWYGWSHRTIYGFEIGSTCKKGDAHYIAANLRDELEAAKEFWNTIFNESITAEKVEDGLIHVSWTYKDNVPNKKLRGTIGGVDCNYNPDFGRGEWTAKTMEDAHQMAIDFNEGVS